MNNKQANRLSGSQLRDLKVIVKFVSLYCRQKHCDRLRLPVELPPELAVLVPKGINLCNECADLLLYGIQKRKNCPLDPKPTCKNCRIHCYNGDYREKIRAIMAYSGRQMVIRGRLDYLWHYFF
ncbi:nitrous oxide-stimulated promoter family protein [Geobacter sp. OR-1]|uniref:nitrous oxide-stimulated promoter family protein n=1 Tax=Geobacter sp. OR-1 TaxID=1266765 RepID=UPI0009DDF30B|nr:nitrous oxide-stimulated promoter family protein [Geobacter sp. OR-1]